MPDVEYDDYGRKVKKQKVKREKSVKSDIVSLPISHDLQPLKAVSDQPIHSIHPTTQSDQVDTQGESGTKKQKHKRDRVTAISSDYPKYSQKDSVRLESTPPQQLKENVNTVQVPLNNNNTQNTIDTLNKQPPSATSSTPPLSPVLHPSLTTPAPDTSHSHYHYFQTIPHTNSSIGILASGTSSVNQGDIIGLSIHNHLQRVLLQYLFDVNHGVKYSQIIKDPKLHDLFCSKCLLQYSIRYAESLTTSPLAPFIPPTYSLTPRPCESTTISSSSSSVGSSSAIVPTTTTSQCNISLPEEYTYDNAILITRYIQARLQQLCGPSSPQPSSSPSPSNPNKLKKSNDHKTVYEHMYSQLHEHTSKPKDQRPRRDDNNPPRTLYSFNSNIPKSIGKLNQLSPINEYDTFQQKWKIMYKSDPLFTIHAEMTKNTIPSEEWNLLD